MDKEKLVQGLMWVSVAMLTIMIDASLLFIGFNNMEHGNYTFITIGLLLLPFIFFFAYKGLGKIMEAIFY